MILELDESLLISKNSIKKFNNKKLKKNKKGDEVVMEGFFFKESKETTEDIYEFLEEEYMEEEMETLEEESKEEIEKESILEGCLFF